MTVPTGLGHKMGIESAGQAPGDSADWVARAASNNAQYGKYDQSPDPCFCGCCDMTRSAN